MVSIPEASQWTILPRTTDDPKSVAPASKSAESGSLVVGSVRASDEAVRTAVVETQASGSVSAEGKSKVEGKEKEPRKKLQKVARKLAHRYSAAEIEDEDFYHGYMTRTEAERLLSEEDQFLLRKSDVNGQLCYLLSVFTKGRVRHFRVRQTHKFHNYWVNDFCFESVSALVNFHRQTGHPIHSSGVCISNYVKKELWELYHEQVDLSGGKLGAGEFGEVMAGFLSQGVFSAKIPVAVKTLRGSNMSSDDRVTFLKEANVMLKLKHDHVVRLYGVATQKQPIMIVMEKASGGSLLSRLKKVDKVPTKKKEKFVHQIVDGMAYLETQQVIHRDLAARNVLLDGESCKISDFGLSLMGKMHKEAKLSKVPVRWLAPETLTQGIYSSKTDVWSFGVVMYEIFSDGGVPYAGHKVLKVVAAEVRTGRLRLEAPPSTPQPCVEMMNLCFEKDPEKRTSFATLKKEHAPPSLRERISAFFRK